MKRILVAVLVSLALVVGCAGTANEPTDPSPAPTPAPNPVLERIKKETDCDVLQKEFDTAFTNSQVDGMTELERLYMITADNRMNELKCFD